MNKKIFETAFQNLTFWLEDIITKFKLVSKEKQEEDILLFHITDFSNEWNQLALNIANRNRICSYITKESKSTDINEITKRELKEGDILLNISPDTNNWNKVALDYVSRIRSSIKETDNTAKH